MREANKPDSRVRGSFVRTTKNGHQSYVLRYSFGGKQHRRTLGDAKYLKVEETRRQAYAILEQVHAGVNPEAPSLKVESVGDLAERYFAEKQRKADIGEMRDQTLTQYRHTYDNKIAGQLASSNAADVRTVDLKDLLADILGSARNRALTVLVGIFTIAKDDFELISRLPTEGIERGKSKTKDRFLSQAEIARIGKALREMEAERGRYGGFQYSRDHFNLMPRCPYST